MISDHSGGVEFTQIWLDVTRKNLKRSTFADTILTNKPNTVPGEGIGSRNSLKLLALKR